MSSLRKMLEAKREAVLAEAQKRAAEIEKDIQELERLTSKYGLQIAASQAAPVGNQAVTSQGGSAQVLKTVVETIQQTVRSLEHASTSRRAKIVAEAYIRAVNHPVPLGELFDVLQKYGINFEGETPRNTLSALLGQTETLYSISRDKGWWIKDVPVPSESLLRMRSNVSTLAGST